MSYFRNFGNVVCSQTFSRPNNLLLKSCHLPKILVQSSQATINHLHTVKALLTTIDSLKNYQNTLQGQYKQQVQSQLEFLNNFHKQYSVAIRKYIQSNGALTGQGIANLYFSANDLGFDSQWLQNYLHNEIPNKVAFMSKSNLQDVIEGVNKFHPNSPHLPLLQNYLSKKSSEQPQYVRRIGNQINQFQYTQQSKSNNYLVRALQQEKAFPIYLAEKLSCMVWTRAMSYFDEQSKYYLHEQ